MYLPYIHTHRSVHLFTPVYLPICIFRCTHAYDKYLIGNQRSRMIARESFTPLILQERHVAIEGQQGLERRRFLGQLAPQLLLSL